MVDSSEGSTNEFSTESSPMDSSQVTQQQQQPSGSFARGTTLLRSGSTASSEGVSKHGCLRVYQTTTTSSSKNKKCQWHKVQYQDRWMNTHLWKRSGTCTGVPSDPTDLVLKRVHFLLQQAQQLENQGENNEESLLPKYHSIFANCECVAVWCKTGTWSTLQASSFLSHAAVGQVKGTAVMATAAASAQATVPAAGLMGWMGFTTTVPLMSVQPLLLPAICAYGAVTIGGPAAVLAYAKSNWKETTKRLNEAMAAESLQVSLVS